MIGGTFRLYLRVRVDVGGGGISALKGDMACRTWTSAIECVCLLCFCCLIAAFLYMLLIVGV
jgi:hypothetical protein